MTKLYTENIQARVHRVWSCEARPCSPPAGLRVLTALNNTHAVCLGLDYFIEGHLNWGEVAKEDRFGGKHRLTAGEVTDTCSADSQMAIKMSSNQSREETQNTTRPHPSLTDHRTIS